MAARAPMRFVYLAAALVAVFAATLSFASAHTFAHGKTVWFSDTTVGDGDEIRGDLDVVFGNVVCENGGVVDGNVRTFFGSFDQRDGCLVGGRVSGAFASAPVTIAPWLSPVTNDDFYAQNDGVLKKLAWDVVVVFAFLLFPMRVRLALDRVERHPGLSFATGAIALVAAIPVAVLLLLSIIGLPLIPLEVLALFAALWIGHAAVGLVLGRRLYELLRPQATPSPLGALLVGLVVITAAQTLPVVGWAVTALVVLVGLGCALLAFVRETPFRAFTGSAAPPPPGPPMNRPA
jgi:hypothetical protein